MSLCLRPLLSRLATNQVGQPMVAWDSSGNPVYERQQTPFMESMGEYSAAGIEINARSIGVYDDRESGYLQNWNRTIDKDLGFLSSDPTGQNGGLNTYLAVNANPLRYVDPMGLDISGEYTDPITGRTKRITIPSGESFPEGATNCKIGYGSSAESCDCKTNETDKAKKAREAAAAEKGRHTSGTGWTENSSSTTQSQQLPVDFKFYSGPDAQSQVDASQGVKQTK